MKYRCTHCNHTFELSDHEFQRCPNCFWTTSLVNLEEESAQKEINASKPVTTDRSKTRSFFPIPIFFGIAVLGIAVIAVLISIQKGNFKNLKFKAPLLSHLGKKQNMEPPGPSEEGSPVRKWSVDQVAKALTEAERTHLSRPFQITVPRQVTEDEEKILKKQVSFPAKLSEKPVIVPWKKEDFENLLSTEQKSRKIQLGWNYERSLNRIFEKNYQAAMKAFDQGDYRLTRTHFIDSLSFPVYRNNRQLYRAVVLVMLRPFINDVIGKIAILNQYLVGQNYLSEVNSIFSTYQALFPVLELQEWEKVLSMITELKDQVNAFEQKPKDQAVPPPASFAALDPEIQSAVQTEASPKPEAAINLKALTVDLDLKEKVVRSNTAEELTGIQKRYQQALLLIGEGNWEEARNILRSIEFPPELVEDVKTKLEIIDKILALSSLDQNQPTNKN